VPPGAPFRAAPDAPAAVASGLYGAGAGGASGLYGAGAGGASGLYGAGAGGAAGTAVLCFPAHDWEAAAAAAAAGEGPAAGADGAAGDDGSSGSNNENGSNNEGSDEAWPQRPRPLTATSRAAGSDGNGSSGPLSLEPFTLGREGAPRLARAALCRALRAAAPLLRGFGGAPAPPPPPESGGPARAPRSTP